MSIKTPDEWYFDNFYILGEYQGKGLGTWLIKCVNEVLKSWPVLRRSILVYTRGEEFSSRRLSMQLLEQGMNGMVIMTRKHAGSAIKD